jgi:hypothetical protein
MTEEEQVFAFTMENSATKLPKTEIITEIAKNNNLDLGETLDTWTLQPIPEAISFALTSPLAKTEGVTPVTMLPLNITVPSTIENGLRFPGFVEKNLYADSNFTLVHIHLDNGVMKVFDKHKNIVSPTDLPDLSPLEEEMSFVLEGFASPDKLFITDILSWDEVWLNRRPAIERITMLWRFPEFFHERIIVRNHADLENMTQKFGGNLLFRNLNSSYNPTKRDSHIIVEGELPTCVLKVTGKKGGRDKTFLSSDDKGKSVQLFEVMVDLDRSERGNCIEVKSTGEVIRNLGKVNGDKWSEIALKWGLDPDPKNYCKNRRVPTAIWHEAI